MIKRMEPRKVLLVLLCLVSSFCAESIFAQELVFEETFDGYAQTADMASVWQCPTDQSFLDLGLGMGYRGSNGVLIGQKKVMYHVFDEPIQDCVLEIRFYWSSEPEAGKVYAGAGPWSVSKGTFFFVGLIPYPGNVYYYRDQISGGGWEQSVVEKQPGWHTLKYVLADGGAIAYMDDIMITRIANIDSLEGVGLGSFWPTPAGLVIYDRIAVYKQ
jgi:hypothetical protein